MKNSVLPVLYIHPLNSPLTFAHLPVAGKTNNHIYFLRYSVLDLLESKLHTTWMRNNCRQFEAKNIMYTLSKSNFLSIIIVWTYWDATNLSINIDSAIASFKAITIQNYWLLKSSYISFYINSVKIFINWLGFIIIIFIHICNVISQAKN